MKINLPTIPQEPEPKGKRTVRENIWGNIVGYIGRKRWIDFGKINASNRREAAAWKAGDPNWKDA